MAEITQRCLWYCWAGLTQTQSLFCLSPHSTSEDIGGAQGFWRGDRWDSQPQVTKGIFQTIQHHTQHIELEEERGKRGYLEKWWFSSQVTITHDGALLSRGWLETYLPIGSREWIPYFALLLWMALAFPIKLSSSEPTGFLIKYEVILYLFVIYSYYLKQDIQDKNLIPRNRMKIWCKNCSPPTIFKLLDTFVQKVDEEKHSSYKMRGWFTAL